MSTPDPSSLNPYAPPSLQAQVEAQKSDGVAGLWRAGDALVMHRQAILPPICVKSGVETKERVRERVAWFPDWGWLSAPVGFLPVILGASLLQKTARIEYGLSPEWKRRRRKRLRLASGMLLVSACLVLDGVRAEPNTDFGAILVLLGMLLFTACALYGMIATRMVYASRIDKRFIWLKGVCPEMLAQLPPWNGGY